MKTSVANNRIKLLLNWYELQGKNLIGEEELHDLSIDAMLKLFDDPFWNGQYQCWAVEPQHVSALQPHIKHVLQPQLHAYFVEAIRITTPVT